MKISIANLRQSDLWVVMLVLTANSSLQKTQEYGFTRVWVLVCLTTFDAEARALFQSLNLQMCFLLAQSTTVVWIVSELFFLKLIWHKSQLGHFSSKWIFWMWFVYAFRWKNSFCTCAAWFWGENVVRDPSNWILSKTARCIPST